MENIFGTKTKSICEREKNNLIGLLNHETQHHSFRLSCRLKCGKASATYHYKEFGHSDSTRDQPMGSGQCHLEDVGPPCFESGECDQDQSMSYAALLLRPEQPPTSRKGIVSAPSQKGWNGRNLQFILNTFLLTSVGQKGWKLSYVHLTTALSPSDRSLASPKIWYKLVSENLGGASHIKKNSNTIWNVWQR
jgi:hypothetical protein